MTNWTANTDDILVATRAANLSTAHMEGHTTLIQEGDRFRFYGVHVQGDKALIAVARIVEIEGMEFANTLTFLSPETYASLFQPTAETFERPAPPEPDPNYVDPGVERFPGIL